MISVERDRFWHLTETSGHVAEIIGHDAVTESYDSVTELRIEPTKAGTLPGFFRRKRDRTKDDYA